MRILRGFLAHYHEKYVSKNVFDLGWYWLIPFVLCFPFFAACARPRFLSFQFRTWGSGFPSETIITQNLSPVSMVMGRRFGVAGSQSLYNLYKKPPIFKVGGKIRNFSEEKNGAFYQFDRIRFNPSFLQSPPICKMADWQEIF